MFFANWIFNLSVAVLVVPTVVFYKPHHHVAATGTGEEFWSDADETIQGIANQVRTAVEAKHGRQTEYVVERYRISLLQLNMPDEFVEYDMHVRVKPGKLMDLKVDVPRKGENRVPRFVSAAFHDKNAGNQICPNH